VTRIVVASSIGIPIPQLVEELRDSFPGVEFLPASTAEEQTRAIRDADAYVGAPSAKVFLTARKLRWIHVPGTGIEAVSTVPEIVRSDVVVTNARGPHTTSMADHVFAMMLTFAHRLRDLWTDQQAHRWDNRKYHDQYIELSGRAMGILALGGIGTAVARRAHGFGMDVYAVDIKPVSCPPEVKAVWGLERLDDLVRLSDWLVVTAPITPQSRNLLDRRRLGLMKPSAHLIVISRGGIVDEAALIEALRAKRIAGAGLDTFDTEPLPPDSPFWSLENVVISPHASAYTPEMWAGRRQILKDYIRAFLAEESFPYVCDKRAGF